MSPTPRPRGRGGRGGHEPRVRVRTREARALELATQGATQQEIARALGVTQPAVSKMLRRVEVNTWNELVRARGRHKVRTTLRLEFLFREAMHAWEQSKADATRRRQRKTQSGTHESATIAELVTENQHGDPRYLEQARKTMADFTKLWGLDVPQLNAPAQRRPSEFAHLSHEEFRAVAIPRVEALLKKLQSGSFLPTELPERGPEDDVVQGAPPSSDTENRDG